MMTFQNRKRYGSMRDKKRKNRWVLVCCQSFKTVNGMEACATSESIIFDIDEVVECFKTVNGMEACATAAFAEGVATPRKSHFWKVFRDGRFSIAFSDKINHLSFRNRS